MIIYIYLYISVSIYIYIYIIHFYYIFSYIILLCFSDFDDYFESILNITVCQKIIQHISAKHYRCNGQQVIDNETKYPVAMIAKNTQLLTKEMEATNSSKLNVSYNLFMYISYIKLRSLYNKLYLYRHQIKMKILDHFITVPLKMILE